VLSSWFIPRNPTRLKQDSMTLSRQIQRNLRTLLPAYFFQDVSKLRDNFTVAALLVWAAMPVSTSIDFENGEIKQFDTAADVFWEVDDPELRHAVVMDGNTTAGMAPALLSAHTRLMEAGDPDDASRFDALAAVKFQKMAAATMGNTTADNLVLSLLETERDIIHGAAKALKEVNDTLGNLALAPVQAIKNFSQFGSDLTDSFHSKLSSVFDNGVLRTVSTMLLMEASRAIDPTLAAVQPQAMLSIITLVNGHTFNLNDFLAGTTPPKDQVALAQTLVNIAG